MEVKPKPVQRKPLEWFNLKGKRVGFWAYVVMRLSAVGLVLYLFLHLVILSQLAVGPAAWDNFVALAKSPAVLLLDVVLIIGILAHGLNGIRLTLIGFGLGVPRQKLMLWIGLILTLVFGVLSALAIFAETK
ncbi:succinate dehydrogenase / fumarate reductase, cytochrome b subunit [Thermoflexales bacterium]|nr:succinate dehydrogenase / fumarate reductase, cytochrome b subunit [Thermoflexales bacterium]